VGVFIRNIGKLKSGSALVPFLRGKKLENWGIYKNYWKTKTNKIGKLIPRAPGQNC
jgi:hypothetical protein